ncbi:MAG: hypothetical protein ACSHX5_04095 [Phycisphaerales bacterium]
MSSAIRADDQMQTSGSKASPIKVIMLGLQDNELYLNQLAEYLSTVSPSYCVQFVGVDDREKLRNELASRDDWHIAALPPVDYVRFVSESRRARDRQTHRIEQSFDWMLAARLEFDDDDLYGFSIVTAAPKENAKISNTFQELMVDQGDINHPPTLRYVPDLTYAQTNNSMVNRTRGIRFRCESSDSASGYLFPRDFLLGLSESFVIESDAHAGQRPLFDDSFFNGVLEFDKKQDTIIPRGSSIYEYRLKLLSQANKGTPDLDPRESFMAMPTKVARSLKEKYGPDSEKNISIRVLHESQPIIPCDAIIINLKSKDDITHDLRRLIATLISDTESGELKTIAEDLDFERAREIDCEDVLPQSLQPGEGTAGTPWKMPGITGMRRALDEDYDPVRRVMAEARQSSGATGIHLRLGVSLQSNLFDERESRKRWRNLILNVFAESMESLFIEPIEFYEKGREHELVEHFHNGKLDLAMLPTMAAGDALNAGHKVVAVPLFREKTTSFNEQSFDVQLFDHYIAVAVRRAQVGQAKEYHSTTTNPWPTEILDRVADTGSESAQSIDIVGINRRGRYKSASGRVVPLMALDKAVERHESGLSRRVEFAHDDRGVWTAVLHRDPPCWGLMARYQYERLAGSYDLRAGSGYDVIFFDSDDDLIPNGALVLNKRSEDHLESIRSKFHKGKNQYTKSVKSDDESLYFSDRTDEVVSDLIRLYQPTDFSFRLRDTMKWTARATIVILAIPLILIVFLNLSSKSRDENQESGSASNSS